jgi:signal peptidase I
MSAELVLDARARSAAARTAVRALTVAVTVALAVLWFLFLRPPVLGGGTGYVVVAGPSMLPALHDGDLVVLRRRASYGRDDVVAYRVPAGDPAAGSVVIHRIVGGSARRGYVVRGDNKTSRDPWTPHRRDILGREWLRLPHVGTALAAVKSPLLLASVAAGLFLAFVLGGAGGKANAPAARRGEG